MMRRLAAIAIPCIAVMLAAGCGSSPTSRFYTLSATPAPAAGTPSDLSVAVGPVTIPPMMDRPQMVVSAGPNQVRLDEFNRWAAPLQSNISRVVADNLASILGTPRVSLFPQTTAAAVDYRVAIEVQTFDSAPGDAATLDAVWTVSRSKDGKSQTGRTALREASPSGGYDGVAAAHSRALARMSRDIAGAIQALARSGQ